MGNLILPLLLVALVIPMFLTRRRQQRMMQETRAFQDSLTIGERIMTTAGLHATVVSLGEDIVELEVAPGVVTTWSRLVVKERVEETSEQDDMDEHTEDDVDAGQPTLIKHDVTNS